MLLPFPIEVSDGLGDALSLATAQLFGQVRGCEGPPDGGPDGLALATNLNQKDLYYCQSLLVSTGFNLNGDFFPVGDTWAARYTPVDKPANRRHKRNDIVGHATAVRAVRDDGTDLSLDTALADVPDSFHLFDTTVVYRVGANKEASQELASFIEEVAAGSWWVSMECLFDHFDYALVDASADWMGVDLAKVDFVERNAETAALTKHMRAYNPKATGTYKGKKIGRVLRQQTYAGKGFVPVPANPLSAVYSFDGKKLSGKISQPLHASLSAAGYSPPEPPKGPSMDEQLKAAHLAEATAKTTAEAAVKAEAVAKAEADAAKKAAADALALLEAEKAATAALATKRDELTAQLDATKADLAKAQAELDTIAQDKRLAGITDKVVAAYGLGEDKAKAAGIAKTLAVLTDELVEANLTAVAGIKAVVTPPVTEPVKPTPTEPPALATLVDVPTPVATPEPTPTPEAPKPSRAKLAAASLLKTRTTTTKGNK